MVQELVTVRRDPSTTRRARDDEAPVTSETARRAFRVRVQRRATPAGALFVDVQLESRASGRMVWAWTFSDPTLADELERELDRDLDALDEHAFRRRHRVTSDR